MVWLSTVTVTSVGVTVPSLRVCFRRNGNGIIACKNTGKATRLVFGLGLGRVCRLWHVFAMRRECWTAAGRVLGMEADDLPEIKWNNACSVDSPSPSRVSISIFWFQNLELDRV